MVVVLLKVLAGCVLLASLVQFLAYTSRSFGQEVGAGDAHKHERPEHDGSEASTVATCEYGGIEMAEGWPKIKAKHIKRVSPWVAIIERAVEFAPNAEVELYHALEQQDYIAIVATLPDGRIPLVKQYRPAVESFTWELPAGLVDPGEDAVSCCRRELVEETGYAARAVHALGTYAPCTSRLSNRMHSFYVETGPVPQNERIESGIEVRLVNPQGLAKLIADGEFNLQPHIGALLLAGMRGYIDLGAFQNVGGQRVAAR